MPAKTQGNFFPTLPSAKVQKDSYLPSTQSIQECSASILLKVALNPHFTDGQSKWEREVRDGFLHCFSQVLQEGVSSFYSLKGFS